MSELIQWPRARYWDKAWNPIVGCRKCSPACENCWAEAWAKRFGQSFEPHETRQQRAPQKGVVFCGNMTDLFGEWAESFLFDDFGEDATYLWLTKRVSSMVYALKEATVLGSFDQQKHYFGFTAENQECWDRRLDEMTGFPWWARAWVSLEPLLGAVDLRSDLLDSPLLRWVVVGCESGPRRRPCKVELVESVVAQCQEAGVAVFVKQLDLGGKVVTDIEKFPEELRIRQVPWAGRIDEAMKRGVGTGGER